MVHPGLGGLDTPRTNIGDATYLSQPPDFDISQELTFHSPTKDGNIFDQLRNGGRPNLRTPRGNGGGGGSRAPLGSRQNLPEGIGGVEFTPLLKSATRNSARRGYRGKENGATGAVPISLGKIDEDDTTNPVPGAMDMSSFGISRNTSYVESTPLPNIDSSSIASTPIAPRQRGAGSNSAAGPLQDGNQLSLREQENVIDRIEKENFGLKLKIHFLEDALRKAGPGFSEAALKENTELKVDKVTLQRELQRVKKLLITTEKTVETYRLDMQEMQEKMSRRQADEGLRAELDRLREELATKDADIEELQRQVHEQNEKARDEVEDLEADLREKDRIITQKEDELEDLQASMETRMEEHRERVAELEDKAGSSEKLEEAKETIEELEADIRRLEQQVDDMKEKLEEAATERQRAEDDLEELQEEMANKSVHTKGLSRQVEEKLARLQSDVEKSQKEYAQLEEKHEEQQKEAEELKLKLKESRQARDTAEREAVTATSQLKEAQADLNMARDQKTLLQTRHDTLTNESATLQRDVSRLQKSVTQLENELEEERLHSQELEQDLGAQVKAEIERLNKKITDLQTEISEKEHLYDIDSERWETDREHLEADRNRLQHTINRLRETEGALSGKEAQLQELLDSEKQRHQSEENILRRQLESLQKQLETRQSTLDGLRKELASVRDELRAAQLNSQSAKNKTERLEDEVESLRRSMEREADEARFNKESAEEERNTLKQQLASLRASGNRSAFASSTSASTSAAVTALQEAAASAARQHREQIERMRGQVSESAANVAKMAKEKQGLQDQLANMNIELRSLQVSLTETEAERDEVATQLRQSRQHEGDTFRVDQERIDLRTAKIKLDAEVRRLREENRTLAEQRNALEETLEAELDKAATEEERLGQEIRQLQSMRTRASATEGQELQAARRTIRDLERRIEDMEVAAATASVLPRSTVADNDDTQTGELLSLRRDLATARAKEKEYLQREVAHKEAVKVLRRQISDLERAAHEAEIGRLMGSPSVTEDVGTAVSVSTSAAHKAEIVQLRGQLTAAHQSAQELKRTLREVEREAATSMATADELEDRINEVEEERAILEQALDEAQEAAAEAASAHAAALHKAQSKLERYRHQRDELALALADAQNDKTETETDSASISSEMSREERSNLHAMLRKTQVEAEALEHELREHRAALEEAAESEEALRAKLERARGERATFRADAERLQQEIEELHETASKTRAALHYGTNTDAPNTTREIVLAAAAGQQASHADTDALVRAAEEQSIRHRKELRGLSMQIEWMQARWEREAHLRNGAVLGKQLVSQDLEMRIACNKADLQMLQGILQQLGVKQPVLQSSSTSTGPSPGSQGSHSKALVLKSARKTLRRAVLAVQFVVRARRAAGTWAQQEAMRQRLAAAAENVRKAERMQQMRAEWRLQLAATARQ